MDNKKLVVNDKEFNIVKLLGKGKGGYSYLADDGEKKYVLKQIHHEPCAYYQFGNKRGIKYWSKTPEFLDYVKGHSE